jgi:hypothetical protein
MDDDTLLALVRAALRDEPPAALVDAVASWPAPGPDRAGEDDED